MKTQSCGIVPAVIGTLRSATKHFGKRILKLGIACKIGMMQKTFLLGTTRKLGKCWKFRGIDVLVVYGHSL